MGVLGKLSPFSRVVAISRRGEIHPPVLISLLIALSTALLFASLVQAGTLNVLEAAAAEGMYGLRVTPGSSCTSPNTRNIKADVKGLKEACDRITAGDPGGVTTTGSTTFKAGDEIVLRNSFTVAHTFTAIIASSLTQWAYVQDNSPAAEKSYNASFYLNVDSLNFNSSTSDRLHHFVGYSSDGTPHFRVVLRLNGEKRLYIESRNDNGAWVSTENSNETPLSSPGYYKIEINWSAGAGNGEFQLVLNDEHGAPWVLSSTLNNGGAQIDHIKWGAVGTDPIAGIDQIGGYLDIDEFSSWR